MEIVFSHILAFSVLFVGGVFDWKTTEVPDPINILGVLGGIMLHLYASLPYMNFPVLLSPELILMDPVKWFTALGDPFLWSIGIGIAFSIYGWSLYILGMWGGADAFAMSVLGFAAPFSLEAFNLSYPISIFVAVLLLGFVYTLLFGFKVALKNKDIFGKTWERLKQEERRVALEVILAAVVSSFAVLQSFRLAIFYYVMFLAFIVLIRFFRIIEDDLMVEEVDVEDLEGGEVLTKDEEMGGKVEGITEEDIEKLDKETVEIRSGLKFVPVFPVALFLVDVIGFRISWIILLLN